jgi:hypothetical protein
MVESEEYCHRSDPRKCVTLSQLFFFSFSAGSLSPGNVCTLRRGSA